MGQLIWNKAFLKVFGWIEQGYQWIKVQENKNTALSLLKNFLNCEMLKQFLFNLPWTIWAWINVVKEREMLEKFPSAFKRSFTLSAVFMKQKEELLSMVNWLYLRLFINPRKTLNILSRPKIEKQLICNGQAQTNGKKWLGNCFFERNGQGRAPQNLKLKKEVETFLKSGKNLKEQPPAPVVK